MITLPIAIAAKLAGAGRFLKSINPKVWIVLAAIAAVLLGSWWHGRQVRQLERESYAKGYAAASADITARAKALQTKLEGLAIKIREKNDATNRDIAVAADRVRLRGPGKAACPGFREPAGTAGGSLASGRADDAGPSGVSGGDRIAVPFGYIVDQAERCDLNRAEVLSWRDWYRTVGKSLSTPSK